MAALIRERLSITGFTELRHKAITLKQINTAIHKMASNRSGIGADKSGDENNKTFDDNAPPQQELMRAALDELLQTVLIKESKLRAAIDAKQESKHQWRVREKGLRYSNWKLENENTTIREQTDRRDDEILAAVEKSEKDHDELNNYKLQNQQEAANFWTYFQRKTKEYSRLFPNAQMEYSSDCLEQDISVSLQESNDFREQIAKIKEHVDSLTAKYGLAEHETNKDAKILKDFDVAKTTISDNSALLRATRSTEDNIDVLKLTIKQKNHDIDYLKNKARNKH